MKYLFAQRHGHILNQLATARVLVALDFDGTLAPVVADRHRAKMRKRTRHLLGEVAKHYPCAVISGRSKQDVMGKLGKPKIDFIIGNHGLEPLQPLRRYRPVIRPIKSTLERELSKHKGVDIEDKQYTLAIHYRQAVHPAAVQRLVNQVVRRENPSVRLVPGKEVINIIPDRSLNKGRALLQVLRAIGADCAIYVGDDDTDEDVFALTNAPRKIIGVRVGARRTSRAPYYLKDQTEIDKLLSRLLSLRVAEA